MWALRAARVFDGHDFIEEPCLVIDSQGMVVSVGETPPPGVEPEDLGDATLLPGLVDCHQHLVFNMTGTLEDQVGTATDDALTERAMVNARRALAGGVTTLRDLGDRNYVTLDLRDRPDMPTIVASGPPITPTGGHCWYLGGEVDGPDELLAAVRERVERGCDVVKIMVTGGAMTPSFPLWKSQFSIDDVRLVVDEAHRHGLPVAAHCHGVEGISAAVDVGVDSIEHCTFFTEAMESSPTAELLDRLAASATALSATWGNNRERRMAAPWDAAVPVIEEALGRVHAGGGTLVVGTDAGIHSFKPHDVLPHAFPTLISVGLSTVQALRAITSTAADVCRRPERGRLAAGVPADVIAIEGDPTTDPAALARVERVWKQGRPIR